MRDWGNVKLVMVGGLVAVGFLDESRIFVGSHSGVGIIDARSGSRLDRVPDIDGSYEWLDESQVRANYDNGLARQIVSIMGLWGGHLRTDTDDGWTCEHVDNGAALTHGAGDVLRVFDEEEFRAIGFSPEGQVFVYATSPTLSFLTRV